MVKPLKMFLRLKSTTTAFGDEERSAGRPGPQRVRVLHRQPHKIRTTALTTLRLRSRSLTMKPFLPTMRQPGRGRHSARGLPAFVILAIGAFFFCADRGMPSATGASDFSPLPKESAVILTNAIILISPKVLDFGSVTTGKTVTDTLLVENVGGGKLVGTASVSAPFKIISGGDYSLKEKQVQVVTVAYTPARTGAVSAKITFTGGGGAKATVAGSAVSPRE
jgi:hypothetical protein